MSPMTRIIPWMFPFLLSTSQSFFFMPTGSTERDCSSFAHLYLFNVCLLSTYCLLVTGLVEHGRRGIVPALTGLMSYYEETENKRRSKCLIRNCDNAMKEMDFGESVQRGPEVVTFKLILKEQKDLFGGQEAIPGREDGLTKHPGAGNGTEPPPVCGIQWRIVKDEFGGIIRGFWS